MTLQTWTPAALATGILAKYQAHVPEFLDFPCLCRNSPPCPTILEIPLFSLKSVPQAGWPLFPAPAFYNQERINVSHVSPYAPIQCHAAPSQRQGFLFRTVPTGSTPYRHGSRLWIPAPPTPVSKIPLYQAHACCQSWTEQNQCADAALLHPYGYERKIHRD